MSNSRIRPDADTIRTVLFDLDGTLLDTAPDLADALNRVLEQNGRQSLPYENIRPVVSHEHRFKFGHPTPTPAAVAIAVTAVGTASVTTTIQFKRKFFRSCRAAY